jgi:ubiquinone/menaquinone biosynthesis C-methylase UbiE
MKKRSHRYEKMARVYDDEILPIWSQRFGRMLLRDLQIPHKAMVLDVGCGTGYPSLELLKLMDEQGRIIALEPIAPLLDVARKKAGDLSGKRIFFRSEHAVAKLAFADEVYDLVVSNLGLLFLDDPRLAVREFSRVAKVGGKVIFTLPMKGTYTEFFDIYREVLTKHDKDDVLRQLEEYLAQVPDIDDVVSWLESAGLQEIDVEVDQFSLLFKSSREFFFAPVIEYGPLNAWKDIAGKGQEMQEIFWHIKEAIDAYFDNRAFELSVKAGCFRGVKAKPSQVIVQKNEIGVSSSPPSDAGDEETAKSRLVDEEGKLRDIFALDEEDSSEQ